jgi:hypothetical protein
MVQWLKDGGSIYDLQARLDHSSIKTTEIYLKYLTPEKGRVAKGPATAPVPVPATPMLKVVTGDDPV